ncbi:tyrosine-protein kinase Wzc [Gibbsiella quercinecans]|uniref:Tyrosine protein kinase n=1 Tax=Gibbsiella quercinecans TaxID=929813 RepID=A0A250AXQ1_9GAMM|nr:tyrosine-protein kinase Wzc [Gibbsiella quercinecans]ATA18625.1 tyrosine protein kinase [Gibbsiella quercinecans]RLM14873.1 tyrosine-protein kinase [Gibbsiella quercinecans]
MDKKINSVSKDTDTNDEIDIAQLYGSILDNRWLIIAITVLFTAIGIIYTMFSTPVYQADALVQVEKDVGSSILNDIASFAPNNTPSSTAEIELIQSRMIIGKTINELDLENSIEPKYFPVFGKGWARLIKNKTPEVAVSRLAVPPVMLGQEMELTINENNSYILSYDGDELINGKVGVFSEKNGVSILVSDTDAEPGTTFLLKKTSFLDTIRSLQRNLTVEDKGKDTGVLSLTLTGEDPINTQRVLASIVNNYLLQNVERKSEEAEKSLGFVKEQLPLVREKLDEAENKLNLFRKENDSVDLSLEAKSMLDTIVNVESQLNELTFKEAEISKLYTKEHPSYRTLLEQRKTLELERDKLNKRVSELPKTQQEIIRLKRDVDSGQEIYMQLLNKQQELSINKASTVGNVRIVDQAMVANKPVQPKTVVIIFISFVLGGIFSILYVLIKTILHRGIESPEQLEKSGINVYASVPLSDWQLENDRKATSHKAKQLTAGPRLLANINPVDLAMEAIRSLRTSLHFAMLDAKNNILMISGTSPGIGKTFVSTNLSAVIAQANNKVIFIDCDMRKGYAHELFGIENEKGLSEYLSNQASIDEIISDSGISSMDVISRGRVPPNPSELLMSDRFTHLLNELQSRYDIVVIDTPPILAVTDAAVIGRHAGTSMLVAGFEKTTLKEVEVSIRRFEQNGIDVKGAILNLVVKKAAGYYGYGYYQYSYESKTE